MRTLLQAVLVEPRTSLPHPCSWHMDPPSVSVPIEREPVKKEIPIQ
jgi:hypothetical protein